MNDKKKNKPDDTANPGNQYAPINQMPRTQRKGMKKEVENKKR